MQTANSHPSNRPIPFFATKTPGTDFSFTLNLNSFCQSCLAPNLQFFTAKPQHPGCSQSESWDGPHQPPYEHPKSVINNKNQGSCDRDQTKLPTVVFLIFEFPWCFFFDFPLLTFAPNEIFQLSSWAPKATSCRKASEEPPQSTRPTDG